MTNTCASSKKPTTLIYLLCTYACMYWEDIQTWWPLQTKALHHNPKFHQSAGHTLSTPLETIYVPAFSSGRVSSFFSRIQSKYLSCAHLTEIVEGFGFWCRCEVGKYYFLGLALQMLAVVGIRRSEYGAAIADGQIATWKIGQALVVVRGENEVV